MMMLKLLMVLIVLEGATAGKAINNTSDVHEQVEVDKEMNNTSNDNEQVTVGKEMNNTNDVCSPFNIKEFRDKTCANLVNSTYILNIKNLNILARVCSKVTKNYAVNIKNKPIVLCEEVHDCVRIISSSATACNDIERRLRPKNLDIDKIEHEYTALKNTLLPIQYTFFGIFMLVGITMNGLLIVIFIRHKNARTDPILINLAVVDIFNLVIIIPVKI